MLGGAAMGSFACLIFLMFTAASAHKWMLSSPQVAAVVSAVLVNLTNEDRAQNSLETLTINPELVKAAQAKADDMAAKGYFAHKSPEGLEPWYFFRAAGYQFEYAGENLAVDFTDSGDVERAWMNSPRHRANILDGRFTEVGIATAVGTYQGRTVTFVVQMFGTQKAQAAAGNPQTEVISTVPYNPADMATVSAKPQIAAAPAETRVLGSAADDEHERSQGLQAASASPSLFSLERAEGLPWWAILAAFPRATMMWSYAGVAGAVLASLAYVTQMEFRKHHVRHYVSATLLIGFMAFMFFIANYFFFVEPVLASGFTHIEVGSVKNPLRQS
jgi:hypothetical protein